MKKFACILAVLLGQSIPIIADALPVNITEEVGGIEVRDSHSFRYNNGNYIALGIYSGTVSAISIRKDGGKANGSMDGKFYKSEEVAYVVPKLSNGTIIKNAGAPAVLMLDANYNAFVAFTSFGSPDHTQSRLYYFYVNLLTGVAGVVLNEVKAAIVRPTTAGEMLFENNADGAGMADPFVWLHNNVVYMMAAKWSPASSSNLGGSRLVWSMLSSTGRWSPPWFVHMSEVNNRSVAYPVDRPDTYNLPGRMNEALLYDFVVEAPYVALNTASDAVSGAQVLWSVGWSDYPRPDRPWQGIRCGVMAYSGANPFIIAKPLKSQTDIQVRSVSTFYTHADRNPESGKVRVTSKDGPLLPGKVNVVDTDRTCYAY